MRIVLQILFLISKLHGKKSIKTGFGFLIQIHSEDGFLGGEIRFLDFEFDFKILNPDSKI